DCPRVRLDRLLEQSSGCREEQVSDRLVGLGHRGVELEGGAELGCGLPTASQPDVHYPQPVMADHEPRIGLERTRDGIHCGLRIASVELALSESEQSEGR